MKLIHFIILLVLFEASGIAAGPVCHAHLSERFLEHFPKYNQEERKAFLIGSLFPDIRYLSKINRDDTHFDPVSLQDVLEEPSAFMAGLKFHSYVDITREEYVVREKIYDQFADASIRNFCTFLKIVEDEVIFDRRTDWDDCVDMLTSIDPEELQWNINEATIRKWHDVLTLFFTVPSSTVITLLKASSQEAGFVKEDLSCWSKYITLAAQNLKMQCYVSNLLDHFEEKFALQKTDNFD